MNDRLTKSDSIRHRLRTLAKDGPNALKVGPMSTKLKVSRGSFYWQILLQKSLRSRPKAHTRNNRIRTSKHLNQHCKPAPNFESMLLTRMPEIFLQQYRHFRDIADFRSQLLRSWQESSTDQVIQNLDAREAEPDRLKHLMRRAFGGTRNLDRAIRSSAAEDQDVARIVASVDGRRVARIAKLLAEVGVEGERRSIGPPSCIGPISARPLSWILAIHPYRP